MTAVPSLSVCCMTADPPAQVAASLRALRPVADEIVVAVDSRVDTAALRAYDDVADRVVRFRFRPPVDRPRAWLVEQCHGDWILSIDGDEVPSQTLVGALPGLVVATDVVQYWLPRRWLHPDAATWLGEAPWWPDFQIRLVRNIATLAARAEPHAGFVAVLPSRHVDAPLYHLDCVVNDAAARAAKAEGYAAVDVAPLAYGGGLLNEVLYRPERWATASGRPVPDEDRPLIDAVLAARRAAEQPGIAGSASDAAVAESAVAGSAGESAVAESAAAESAVAESAADAILDEPAADVSGGPAIVSDADIDARASSPGMTDGDYAVDLRLFDPIRRLAPGEVRPLYVEVANRGGAVWRWGLDQQPEVRVSYHWRTTGGAVTVYDGMRSPLPCTVGPGDAALVPVWVQAPDERGDHVLEIDLVHEHVRWFGSPLTLTVTVAERTPTEVHEC